MERLEWPNFRGRRILKIKTKMMKCSISELNEPFSSDTEWKGFGGSERVDVNGIDRFIDGGEGMNAWYHCVR